MYIDNSQANDFRTCPLLWYERNTQNLELKPKGGEVAPLNLGSRVHELLEEHYKGGAPLYGVGLNEDLENEAQMLMEAYKAKYPREEFEIVNVERTFKIQLPDLCPKCYANRSELRDSGCLTCLECGAWD